MSDRILHRYLDIKNKSEPPAPADGPETADDLGAFGFLRGIRDRAIMLELRHCNGRFKRSPMLCWNGPSSIHRTESHFGLPGGPSD